MQYNFSIRIGVCLALTAVAVGANAQETGQGSSPELFHGSEKLATLGQEQRAKVIARVSVRDGAVEFVEHPDGSVGIGSIGEQALSAVNALLDVQKATPLEVFLALGGGNAPKLLLYDHKVQRPSGSPGSEQPRNLSMFATGIQATPAAASSGEHFISGIACGDEDLGLWNFWFNSQTNYDTWGAHDISGTGQWTGDAVISLGPSSAGVLTMCRISTGSPTVRVQEYFGGLGWVLVWNPGYVYEDFAYGYRYSGYVVRKMRMTVTNFAGGTMFWGASY